MQTAAKGGVKTLNTPVLGVLRELGAPLGAPLSSHLEILPPSKGMFSSAKAVESVVPNSTQLHGTPSASFVLNRAVSPISPHPSQCLYFHF